MFQFMTAFYLLVLLLLGCEITLAKGFSIPFTKQSTILQQGRISSKDSTIHHFPPLLKHNAATVLLLSTRGGAIVTTTTTTTTTTNSGTSRLSQSTNHNNDNVSESNNNKNNDDDEETGNDGSISDDEEIVTSTDGRNEEETMSTSNIDKEDGEIVEEEEELVVSSSFEESMKEAKTQEQASGSYFLSSVLWLSLAFDVILNKGKRLSLFGQEGLQLVNIVSTFHLAIGFMLASGLSYWLSYQEGHHQNKLPLVLCFFGLLNVGAHAHPTQLFLGQGAAIINIHNALVSINEYWKRKQLALATKYYIQSWKKKQQTRIWNVTSKLVALLCLTSSIVPILRSFPKTILPLEWASLARSTLLAGVALNYHTIRNSTTNWHCSAMISIAMSGLALPMWIVRFMTSSSDTTTTAATLPSLVSTISFSLLACVLGWDAIQSYRISKKETSNNKSTVTTE